MSFPVKNMEGDVGVLLVEHVRLGERSDGLLRHVVAQAARLDLVRRDLPAAADLLFAGIGVSFYTVKRSNTSNFRAFFRTFRTARCIVEFR